MGENSKIEWTDATWNPLAGCTKVSPGCAHCYAEGMAKRLRAMGQEKYADVVDDNGRWTGHIWLGDEKLVELPLTWRKPRMVFVDSMSDLFHESVPFEFIKRVFYTMMDADWHIFQVLTKRARRALEFFGWLEQSYENWAGLYDDFAHLYPNIWLLASVEDQKRADERIPYVLQWPTAVKGLSMEPLLGPVNLWSDANYTLSDGSIGSAFDWGKGVNWVIVGGESGPNARPMHPDWARSIRDQCQVVEVPFFFKQWGEWAPDCLCSGSVCKSIYRPNPGKLGRMFRCGKKAAGRLLDGRTWDQFPEDDYGQEWNRSQVRHED